MRDANNSPKHARIDMEIRSLAQMAKKQLLKMAKKKNNKSAYMHAGAYRGRRYAYEWNARDLSQSLGARLSKAALHCPPLLKGQRRPRPYTLSIRIHQWCRNGGTQAFIAPINPPSVSIVPLFLLFFGWCQPSTPTVSPVLLSPAPLTPPPSPSPS